MGRTHHEVSYSLPLFRFLLLQTLFLTVPSEEFTCFLCPQVPVFLLPLAKRLSGHTRETKEVLAFCYLRRRAERRQAVKLLGR